MYWRNGSVVSLLFLVGCHGATISSPLASPVADGGALLGAVEARYRACDTYEDHGIVFHRTAGDHRSGEHYHTGTTVFSTAMDRKKNGYRYEFYQKYSDHLSPKRGVSWRNVRDGELSWWSVTARTEPRAVYQTALSFKGVGDWSAYRIPALLFGWEGAFRGARPSRGRDEVIDGEPVATLEGATTNYRVTLWVSLKTLLIRRTYEVERIRCSGCVEAENGAPDETVTDYFAKVDGPIDGSRFLFTEP